MTESDDEKIIGDPANSIGCFHLMMAYGIVMFIALIISILILYTPMPPPFYTLDEVPWKWGIPLPKWDN